MDRVRSAFGAAQTRSLTDNPPCRSSSTNSCSRHNTRPATRAMSRFSLSSDSAPARARRSPVTTISAASRPASTNSSVSPPSTERARFMARSCIAAARKTSSSVGSSSSTLARNASKAACCLREWSQTATDYVPRGTENSYRSPWAALEGVEHVVTRELDKHVVVDQTPISPGPALAASTRGRHASPLRAAVAGSRSH